MIPRFSNPHNLNGSLQLTTRASLTDCKPEAERNADRDAMLNELERLMRRTIGDIHDSLKSRDPKADIENPERKRRRLESTRVDSTEHELESMPFRLISRFLPPKPVALQPTPGPVIIVKEPPCEDNDEEAEVRKQQASAAAVDIDWLLKESKKPSIVRTALFNDI